MGKETDRGNFVSAISYSLAIVLVGFVAGTLFYIDDTGYHRLLCINTVEGFEEKTNGYVLSVLI